MVNSARQQNCDTVTSESVNACRSIRDIFHGYAVAHINTRISTKTAKCQNISSCISFWSKVLYTSLPPDIYPVDVIHTNVYISSNYSTTVLHPSIDLIDLTLTVT